MPSLNLDLNYFDHRKTKRLIGLLGRGAEVLPIRLWCYCGMHHAESGRLADYSPQEIETIVEWWGKPGEAVAALVKVGFLDECDGGFQVHQWDEHEGHIVAYHLRAKTAAAARWKEVVPRRTKPKPKPEPGLKADASSNASSNAKRELKQCQCSAVQCNAEQKDKSAAFAAGVPPSASEVRDDTAADPDPGLEPDPEFWADFPARIKTPAVRAAWVAWCQHRRESRNKITPTAARQQIGRLAEMGPERAEAALLHSTANGYRGVFEPPAARVAAFGRNGSRGPPAPVGGGSVRGTVLFSDPDGGRP